MGPQLQPAAPALVDLIQTGAPISPGNSGGALVDREGEVIGINVAYLPPGETGAVSLGFAIPAPTAAQVMEQLVQTSRIELAFLGIEPIQVTPELATRFDGRRVPGGLPPPAVRRVERDVEKGHALQVTSSRQGPDVDGPVADLLEEIEHVLLRQVVIAGDEPIERNPVALSSAWFGGEDVVECLHDLCVGELLLQQSAAEVPSVASPRVIGVEAVSDVDDDLVSEKGWGALAIAAPLVFKPKRNCWPALAG